MDGEELIHRGVKFPKSLDDKLTAEMGETGLDRTSLVRKIVFEHYRQKEHPEWLVDQMKMILLKDPKILHAAIGNEVKAEVQTQLRELIGTK